MEKGSKIVLKTEIFTPPTLETISREYGVDMEFLVEQYELGSKEELEHTPDMELAESIALHHLNENPNYYILLRKALEEDEAKKLEGYYAKGGSLTCEQLKDNIIKFIDKLIKIKKEREEVLRNTLMRETPDPPKSIEEINIEKYEAYLKEKKQKKAFNYICNTCLVQKTKEEFRSHNHDCRKCENIKNAARAKVKNYNKKRKSRAKSSVVNKAS